MKILLVDDDKCLAKILSENLKEHNFVVDVVTDGEAGWYYASSFTYDLILLDVLMPKLDGLSLCQRLREHHYSTPILLLTARNSSIDKIKGLNAGADDYIVKPFDFEELIARIRAILRRDPQTLSPLLQWGNLSLDPSSRIVVYENRPLNLTPKQYALLELLLRNPGRVFSPAAIIDRLWSSEEIPGEDTVRTHIKELRQKLKAVKAPSNLIKTVYGQGYCLKKKQIKPASSHAKKNEQIAALNKIWEEEYREVFIDRLEVFERVKQEFVDGLINPKLQREAELLAHNLAGTLGSFGKQKGSQLAIELERILQTNETGEQQQSQKFLGILSALRKEIEQSANLKKELSSTAISAKVKHNTNILIIDSGTNFIKELIDSARVKGLDVSLVSNFETAREVISCQQIDGVIIEICFFNSCSCSNNRSPREFLLLIQSLKNFAPNLPIFVIADRGNFSDRLEVVQRGGDIFLLRPLAVSTALDIIDKRLACPIISAKITIVAGDRELLDYLSDLLLSWQLQLNILQDPRLFWEFSLQSNPDLLIVDAEIAGIKGIEFCRVIRSDPAWHNLPILLLTFDRDRKTRRLIFASGADDYITKPILPEELRCRIFNCLKSVI